MRSTLHAAALAALVVLAGCAGGSGIATPSTDAGTLDGDPAADATAGTVRFYISDQPAAIEDFRHLNVTISRVGIQEAGENGSWTEYEVGGRTVDLTRLRGDNATLVGELPLESGSYSKVFVHVESVEGTLSSGEEVRVKLPSEKLQLTKPFTVGPNESVNFVFDIAVHKAGKSGKYILKPVIGESGTDVPIDPVDDDREEDELAVSALGNVTPGEDVTLEVTGDGSPVANATVTVNGEPAGETDEAGRITVAVPADAEELEVEARAADAEGELEVEFEDETDDEREEKESADGGDGAEDGESDALTAAFVGNVTPGEDATLEVTRDGSPVANATVIVNGESAGTTGDDGRLTIAVPADAEELTVGVKAGDAEAELEREFEE